MQLIKARYLIEICAHGLFWFVMYYALQGIFESSFAFIGRSADGKLLMRSGYAMFPYAGVVLAFLILLFYSCAFWLFKKIVRYKNNYARAAAVTGWLLLIYGSNFLLIRRLIGTRSSLSVITRDQPVLSDMPRLPDFATFFSENWEQVQTVLALAFLAVLGIAAAYFLIKEWMRNELMRSKIETLQANTELRFLRAQISPHFLFNTLNNLFSMALKEENTNLADHIAKLSNLMRYTLYESETDKVSLAKEIGCLQDYLALHQMRFATDEINVSFSYPEPATVAAIQVSPMLFIPFLENAFKYGVTIGQQSTIDLSVTIGPKKLAFTCKNKDHSSVKKLEEEQGGIGLDNVRRRLELIYPGKYELHNGPQNGNYLVNLQIDLS
jgi:two-component system, LytTR family, sensor kinase